MFARRPRSFALAAAFGLVLFFFFPTTALAHDHLVSSSPEAGETLTEAPAEITLVYSADLTQAGAIVLITDEAGMDWANSDPVIVGDTVTVAVQDHIASGAYVVQWRVVSSDGHPITGEVPFALELPEAELEPGTEPSVDPEPAEEPAPAETADTVPTLDATPTADETPAATAEPATPGPSGRSNNVIVWAVIGGSVLLAVWITRSRRLSAGPGFQD